MIGGYVYDHLSIGGNCTYWQCWVGTGLVKPSISEFVPAVGSVASSRRGRFREGGTHPVPFGTPILRVGRQVSIFSDIIYRCEEHLRKDSGPR